MPRARDGEATVTRPGVVSVILVNYRGAEDTIACLRAFDEVDWPAERLELIVVDNNSGDAGAQAIRAAVPRALVVDSGANLGFAGGCNVGVARAHGEVVAFINNDARPHPGWIRAAVETFDADREVAAVASKVLDWDGVMVDYADASLTWYGMGYKREAGRPDSPEYDRPKDVLFGTGSALLVRTDVYRAVGGFDERYFMFYEDVDLGWRLNLLGHRVRYVPASLVYHRHHASISKFGDFRESYLLERNALMTLYKNLDDDTLAGVLPAAMALAVRRSLSLAGVDATSLDLQISPGGDDVPTLEVPKSALTATFAIDHFVTHLDDLAETRRDLQRRRRRADRDVMPLFRYAIEPAFPGASYHEAHDALVRAFGIAERFTGSARVLVVTGEPLAERMAGPAIRAWEIASVLATEHEVRLVTTAGCQVSQGPGFAVSHATGGGLREATDWADVIVFQGFLLEGAPWLVDSTKILVADVYDPMHLEQLEQARELGEGGWWRSVAESTRILNEQLARADLVLCASEKQRDFWMGQLAGQGRVNPGVYDEDASLERLLRVVPFGIPDEPPVARRHAIKGAVPGIRQDDKVILWGGGVYNWFDPLTLVRAVDSLRQAHPEVRLFFLGMTHPNPGVPKMRMASRTLELAEELGLLGTHVFYNEGWVAYDERADYLLDADLGVSTHFRHVETAFSFRTRILDYLWAGLPIVATEGDTFATVIDREGLGSTVPAEDVDALAGALERMLYDDEAIAAARSAVERVAQQYRWSVALRPLVDFCRDPRRAADLASGLAELYTPARPYPAKPWNARRDASLALAYLRSGGVGELSRRVWGRARRILAPPR